MKEITIIPSDESIKELWDIRVKFRLNELDEAMRPTEEKMTYERYYAMMKRPIKAYCL
jgi:hypothetical protein